MRSMAAQSIDGAVIPIEGEGTSGEQLSALQPPLNVTNASESTQSKDIRPSVLRSYSSSRELSAIESPNAAATSYATLGYAPRQKPSNSSMRPSQASIQAHSSLWKQQRQNVNSNSGNSIETSSSLLSSNSLVPSSSSLSMASASTPVLEGFVPVQPGEKSAPSNQDKLSAAEALAKQQLRTDVESLGIRVGSIGWALLERLQTATAREWKDLNILLGSGRASLLLPSTPLLGKEITLSQAYNHIIFSTTQYEQPLLFTSSLKGKEIERCSLLTLKGLRMDLIDDTLQSDLHLEIKSFVPREDLGFVLELRDDMKRPGLLRTLMPLPYWEGNGPSSRIRLLAYSPGLLLPPTLSRKRENSLHDRSRTLSNGSTAPIDQQQRGSRASGTFATLFGGRRERKDNPGEEGKEPRDLRRVSESEGPDSNIVKPAVDESLEVTQPTRSIAVAVIDREIRRAQTLDEVAGSMQARIRIRLQHDSTNVSLPEDIVEVVCSFAVIFFPPSNSNSAQAISRSFARSASTDTDLSKSPGVVPMSAPFLSLPDELAESFQDFYASITDQLESAHIEIVDQQLDRIEEAVCEEVYDRIFCPFTSSDRFHDEALTLRITALNEMSIGLSHLGLALPEGDTEKRQILDGIDDIVTRCRNLLGSLDDRRCHAPAKKLAILVSAHRVIVDGLAVLPKIEMIDEVEAKQSNAMGEQKDANIQEAPLGIPDSQRLTTEKQSVSSGADLILPLLLYCVIRLNPPNLASNLLFIQRFHAESLVKGEASYCLVNVQAAVAFLENLEPASLGLTSTTELITAKELEQQSHLQDTNVASLGNQDGINSNTASMPMRMRYKVAHDVGELTGMSNRVITGVLGSSLGAFGRMMGAGTTFAMGIEAESNTSKQRAEEPKQRSIDDVRTLLTGSGGSTVTKLGSALNKVVAIDNEGKTTTTKESITVRPKLGSRSGSSPSTSRPPTDYSRDRETLSPLSSSTKVRISDRLASIPTLNRVSSSASAIDTVSSLTRPTLHQTAEDIVQRTADIDSPSTFIEHALGSSISAQIPNGGTELSAPAQIPTSLQSPYPPVASPPTSDRPLHVVLASTGSVASVKVPLMVWKLLQYENVYIQIISTKASRHFFDVEALSRSAATTYGSNKESYSVHQLAEANANPQGKQPSSQGPRLHIWSDEDEWSQWKKIGDPILHIELRRWADIVLIAPCSANTLAKINAGTCDDLLTSFLRALSPSTPTYLFPAMNTLMYMHPLTIQHLAFAQNVLKYNIVGPIEKRLACGDIGQGAMQEWSDIVNLVVQKYALKRVRM